MSQSDKSTLYQALKAEGVEFSKQFREYKTEELAAAWAELRTTRPHLPEDPSDGPAPAESNGIKLPVREADPTVMAGELTVPEGEPIRQDEQGRIWYQEEVLKAGYAKPRGRRVLRHDNPGFRTETKQIGDYTESYEVAGEARAAGEIKITLPSYQVGIFKDPRFPFKVHTYNGQQGFDLNEVRSFYGGAELVPAEIKRKYVENVLCYDIPTTIRAIQTEHRQLQLAGKVD